MSQTAYISLSIEQIACYIHRTKAGLNKATEHWDIPVAYQWPIGRADRAMGMRGVTWADANLMNLKDALTYVQPTSGDYITVDISGLSAISRIPAMASRLQFLVATYFGLRFRTRREKRLARSYLDELKQSVDEWIRGFSPEHQQIIKNFNEASGSKP